MKNVKRMLCVVLICAVLLTLWPTGVRAADEVVSGTCGENLTWTLDSDGLLTISGTGTMENYSSLSSVPWYSNRNAVNEVLIEDGVTSIGNWAFCVCDSLTSITIPNGVTSIGDGAFEDCDSLTSITIPDSVTSIGNWAFEYCDSLTSITIPDSVTSIGDYAFYRSGLTSITIPNSVTTIGEYAFHWSDLTSITILDGVTSIGDHAFSECSGLTSITIPDSVTSIGTDAFHRCSSLTSIIVDEGNTVYCSVDGMLYSKDKTTLYACPGGKTGIVTIPSGVTSIGDDAFEGCDGLTSITIPASVTSIGGYAFNCSGLTSIIVDDGNTEYCSVDDILYSKDKTTLYTCPRGKSGIVTIPSGVTSIGDNAFSGSGLTSITIPDGVTSIGDDAFEECYSLTSITIPVSVASIGDWAFGWCYSLTDVYYGGSEEGWDAISIGVYTWYGTSATIHYNSTILLAQISGKATATEDGTVTATISGYFDEDKTGNNTGENVDVADSAVEIDVSTGKEASSVEVTIAQMAVQSLATADTVETVVIKTDVADIAFDKTALDTIAAADGSTTLKVSVFPDENSLTVTLTLVDENGAAVLSKDTSETNGTVTVTVPYESTGDGDVVVYYITEDGSKEEVESTYKDGQVTFTTSHFSKYLITEESAKISGDVNGDGRVTFADYTKILSHVKKKTLLEGEELARADVNGDGKVTFADYAKVLAIVKKQS